MGKKEEKTEEEVFDLDPSEEESVTITESDTGFSVGSEQYETEGKPRQRAFRERRTSPSSVRTAASIHSTPSMPVSRKCSTLK